MSGFRLILILVAAAGLAGCSVPPPVPVPLPSSISGQPSPCEPLALAGFPQQDPPSDRTYYVCKPGVFAANFDPHYRTPQWAVQKIVQADLDPNRGTPARRDKNDARPDPDLPEARASTLEDFHDTGYEMGYLVSPDSFPYDDVRYSRAQYLSNAFPLHPDRVKVWQSLADFALNSARSRGEIKVISGTVYENGKGRGMVGVPDSPSSDIGKVEVPTAVFKLIVDAKTGEYIAFLVPNEPLKGDAPPAVIVNWADLEKMTGLVLAPDSPPQWRAIQSRPPNIKYWQH